jgi:hypothetical protein
MRQQSSLSLGLLILATILAPSQGAHAVVGVTSQTDGDPMGKPPTDAERILRVGIDIQANELITTRQNDRAHIVFVDGTSLTVGPNAQLTIDRFVYDPATKVGDIAISISAGVLRVVGGRISKSRPIEVTTPSSTIGIRGGIALFEVDSRETKAQFLFGISLVVSAHGQTQTASRPGSEIVTRFGGFPGQPGIIPPGSLTLPFTSLEGRAGGKGDTAPDARARDSGFSDRNSGLGIPGPSQAINTGTSNRAFTDALIDANTQKSKVPAPTVPPAPQVSVVPVQQSSAPPPICTDNDRGRHDGHREMRHFRH